MELITSVGVKWIHSRRSIFITSLQSTTNMHSFAPLQTRKRKDELEVREEKKR